jgi:hypothetical protein
LHLQTLHIEQQQLYLKHVFLRIILCSVKEMNFILCNLHWRAITSQIRVDKDKNERRVFPSIWFHQTAAEVSQNGAPVVTWWCSSLASFTPWSWHLPLSGGAVSQTHNKSKDLQMKAALGLTEIGKYINHQKVNMHLWVSENSPQCLRGNEIGRQCQGSWISSIFEMLQLVCCFRYDTSIKYLLRELILKFPLTFRWRVWWWAALALVPLQLPKVPFSSCKCWTAQKVQNSIGKLINKSTAELRRKLIALSAMLIGINEHHLDLSFSENYLCQFQLGVQIDCSKEILGSVW